MKRVPWTIALLLVLHGAPAHAEIPYLVGGMAHGVDNINALAELGLGNFVWIPPSYYWESGNTPWNDEQDIFVDVKACLRHDFSFMIGERRGIGDTVRHGGYAYGGHGSGDLHDLETIRKIADMAGDRFIGLHAGELDADFLQNALRPSFMTRVPKYYEFTDAEGGRKSFEGELIRLRNRYHEWGAKFLPNLCVTSHISGFRTDCDIVIAELLEHLPTTELQLAYLRGGARQFDGDWGIWVSPWYKGTIHTEDKELWPMPRAVEGGGHSASSLRRCLWLSYGSGCRLFTAQETEPLFARADDGGYRLAAWGKELKQLWDYLQEHNTPVEPVTPLAILIDRNNGYIPPHLWGNWNEQPLVWGKLPAGRAERAFAEYIDLFLPGFRRTPEQVAAQDDFYPGYFAATPLGPFDIIASDITADRLETYPCVLVLGDMAMDSRLHATLKEYVAHGGTLVLNALHMIHRSAVVEDEDLLGARLDMGGKYSQIHSSSKIIVTGHIPGVSRKEFEEPYFASLAVEPKGADILATDHEQHPVLLRNSYGQGTVYLTTPEYMMEGWKGWKQRLRFFESFISAVVPKTVDVKVEGDVSWVAARRGADTTIIVLANHGGEPRIVNINWDGPSTEARAEVGKVTVTKGNDTPGIGVSIPPEDIAVLSIPRR
jgi:hypothetical protein